MPRKTSIRNVTLYGASFSVKNKHGDDENTFYILSLPLIADLDIYTGATESECHHNDMYHNYTPVVVFDGNNGRI